MLAPLYLGEADFQSPVPAQQYTEPRERSVWFMNEQIAKIWGEYVKDTAITDTTPPPPPTAIKVNGKEITWQAEADLESGLAHFVIERDGAFLARVPESPKNPFGRPIFQNLQYSDTPSLPLVEMKFIDTQSETGQTYQYRVRSVNTVGFSRIRRCFQSCISVLNDREKPPICLPRR